MVRKNVYSLQSAISLLERDKINNVSIINFIKHNKLLSIDIVGTSLMARGISDHEWVYISCDNKIELTELVKLLNPGDIYFAAMDEWIKQFITRNREIVWGLSAVQFYLPDDVQLPAAEHHCVPLTIDYAQTVYINSDYKEFISLEYVRDRIQNGVSAGIFEGNQLVSWGMTQDDGAVGFLHTIENCRRRGYGMSVTLSLIEKLRRKGALPFAYAEESNKRSVNLLSKLKFKKNKMIHWFQIK